MNAEQRFVFIVEDDEGVRGSMRLLLEASGYRVRDFASAEELLAAAAFHEAGCVITDYGLPGATGLDMIELLRARGVRVPAIIVTANARGIAARAERAGVAMVLRKPMTDETLTQWLNEIFPIRR
jgi:two-component system response regulator FixJ